jgi:hypothetical protein
MVKLKGMEVNLSISRNSSAWFGNVYNILEENTRIYSFDERLLKFGL